MGTFTMKCVCYTLFQFAGFQLQILPVLFLWFAAFSRDQLKVEKKKLLLGAEMLLVLLSALGALRLGYLYANGAEQMTLQWTGNVMFALLWMTGSLLYLFSIRKGTNCRLLCYMIALQFGITVYTGSEIGVKFLKWNLWDPAGLMPYGPVTLLFYGMITAVLFPPVYSFLKHSGFDRLKNSSIKNIRLISVASVLLSVLYLLALLAEVVLSFHTQGDAAAACLSLWLVCMLLTVLLSYVIYFRCLFIQEEKERANIQLAAFELQAQSLQEKLKQDGRMRHDLRHHFRTLIAMAQNEEWQELERYLRSYIDEWEQFESARISDNPTVNTILDYYFPRPGRPV